MRVLTAQEYKLLGINDDSEHPTCEDDILESTDDELLVLSDLEERALVIALPLIYHEIIDGIDYEVTTEYYHTTTMGKLAMLCYEALLRSGKES